MQSDAQSARLKDGRDRAAAWAASRPNLAAGIFLAALTAIFFAPTFGADFILRDAFHEFYPMMLYWGWARGGALPLWTPYVNLGAPLAGAVFPATMYPPLGLMLWLLRLPPSLCMNLFIYLHYWLAGMSAWLLLRRLGGKAGGSLTGAVGYSFSGYLVSMHYARNLLPGLALGPLVVALLLRARTEDRLGLAAAAGFGLGLIFLGGDPQGFAVVMALAGAAAIFIAPGSAPRGTGRSRPALLLAVFVVTATAGAAAELLPALSAMRSSSRAAGFSTADAMSWSFHPARLLELFSAGFFGRAWPQNLYWGAFTAGRNFPLPMALSCYLGTWTAFGLFGALRFRLRQRAIVFWGAAALVFLALALGGHTPILPFLLEHVPGFKVFRFPEKYLAYFILGVAVLTGLGTDALMERGPEAKARGRLLFIPAVLFFLLFAATAVFKSSAAALTARALGGPYDLPADFAAGIVEVSWLRAAIVFFLGALVAAWAPRVRAAALLAPALFLFLDLGLADRSALAAAPGFYNAPSYYGAIIADREKRSSVDGPCRYTQQPCVPPGQFRIFRDNAIDWPPQLREPYPGGFTVVNQLTYRRWELDTLKPNLGVLFGLEDFAGMNVGSSAAFDRLLREGLTLDRLPAYNVKYAIVPAEREDPQDPAYRTIARYPGTVLIEFAHPLPRAYWVPAERFGVVLGDTLTEPVEREQWRRMEESGSEPLVPARVRAYAPNRIELEVTAPAAGWLVVNDAWSPGWRAEVAGEARPIRRAKELVRAVAVGKGTTQVVMTLRPPLLRAGLVLSAVGLLAGAAGFIIRR